MKTILFFFLLLPSFLYCQNKSWLILGKLIDNQNYNPIESINITNKTSNSYTYSNQLGLFQIYCQKNDTLIFNGIGYNKKEITVNDSILIINKLLLIVLVPEFYELNEVTITNLGSYKDFKRNFLLIKPQKELIINLGIPNVKSGTPKLLDDNFVKSAAFALQSPISFLYYNLNEKEKSKRKILKLISEAPITYEIEKKFNRDKVSLWTGLKDIELNEFIVFCNFDRTFLLTATDYEIITKTQEKFSEFMKSKNIK